jgi:UDP-N-acetylmuramoyl-tripeptide--D-alanyl-D-alanine ligase
MAMKKLTPDIVAAAVGGRYVGPESGRHVPITSVVRDDRDVTAGSLFVCIRGERVDGHDFAARAFESGAACCLCQRTPPNAEEKPHILVASTLDALRDLGEYYRKLLDIPVVGVTGSVGKTTAKEMIAAALSTRYNVLKTPENLNNEIGVPLTLLSIQEEHEVAVIEMGISDFGEMRRIARMVRPDICVITAIGHSHLENLGNLEGVLRAKAEVFEYMTPKGLAVLNGDDGLLAQYDPGVPVVTFGTGENCAFRAESVRQRMEGAEPAVEFTVTHGDARFDAQVRAFGTHLVLGALAAAAVGHALNVPDDEIARGLLDFTPVGRRARVAHTGYITIIDDCYNANPSSMRAAISSLSTLEGRKVALLGDMFELGEESDNLHREIGEFAARCGIDCLICCGQKAECIYKGLISTGAEIEAWHFPLKGALLNVLPSLIREGDNVLVKASHGMHFEELAQALEALR